MDEVMERPSGQVPETKLSAQHQNEDDRVVFESISAEADSRSDGALPGAGISFTDSQDRPQNDSIQSTRPVRERYANEPCPSPKTCVEAGLIQTQPDSKKRKSPTPGLSMPSTKRMKVDESTAHVSQSSGSQKLLSEIWQHIFTFLPPKMLGRLLSVDRCFNYILDPFPKFSYRGRHSAVPGSLSTLRPEVIWQNSRRRFWPNMPTPLRDHTELQMWQLACRSSCQSCGVSSGQSSSSSGNDTSKVENQYTGPRPIWPFAVTSCAACLPKITTKEIDLLLSSQIPSFLIPALPFLFTDEDKNTISSAMLQTGQVTLTSTVTKVFLSSHIAAIGAEFDSVRRMGEATTEEWLKGLEGRGKEHRADALRWEKFEMSGGILRIRQRLSSRDTDVNGEPHESVKISRIAKSSSLVEKEGEQKELRGKSVLSVTTPATPAPSLVCARESSVSQSVSEHQRGAQVNGLRGKTRERAEEMKAARRAEIERRAMQLEPPLSAQVLTLIPAFQAAIQITSPLSDAAWDLLKSRLIAQRPDVKHLSHIHQETAANSPTPPKRTDIQCAKLLTTENDQVDNDWDDAQASFRAKISALADEIISRKWENGQKVNWYSSPQFAADVLLYVRRRFYAEMAKEDALSRTTGQSPPIFDGGNGPRRLTLENMRWIFDLKVKPLTGLYRKEIFYCHGCQNTTKMYGFEGVVQHYAAKHTNTLSLGSVVVYWRAEWPKTPPFHPRPRQVRESKNRQAGPVNEPDMVFMDAPPAPHGPLFHQEGVLPSYGQAMPHSQYEAMPTQPPYMQGPHIAQPSEYANPFSPMRAHYHMSSSQLNDRSTFQGLPEFPHGSSLFGPITTADPNVLTSHGYTSYENHTAPERQSRRSHQPNHRLKHEEIAQKSIRLWRTIAPIRDISKPIRIFALIHHVVTEFRKRFSEDLPLPLFIDGLSTNKEMRPIRNVNGLQCKVCHLGITTTNDPVRGPYSLLQLVKHFQQHVDELRALGSPSLNWHTDMIHLPDLSILSNLSDMKRIDSGVLAIVKNSLADALSSSRRFIDSANSLLSENNFLNRGGHFSTDNASKQQRPRRRPRVRNPETVIDAKRREGDLTTPKVRERMPKARQPSLILRGGYEHSNKASVDAKPPNAGASTGIQSAPITLAASHDGGLLTSTENDDDDFDLIAGLESQLNQQASAIHL
ncbi:hypothetical protein GGR50DRAFT_350879 [Xylaria sp. CBS 124048]|nr:hypothetical protein GGR50DRAFT_350879 [Xylaria sp. CBS 124048]